MSAALTVSPVSPTSPRAARSGYDPEAVRAGLREHFGFDGLRPGQEAALRPVLDGRDTLVVMPTGAGKSLIYQLAALLRRGGVTVVVSPLIALMKDQVDALRARGVAAAYVNSSQTQAEQRDVLGRLTAGELTLVYAAPERLRVPSFQRALRQAEVTLLAVDEAHCVSQWGHDFRPDYLSIAQAREAMGAPPCVALTATATARVQDDIAEQLRLRDPARLVTGFNRPNLRFEVRSTATAKQKRRVLKQFLAEHEGEAGLIYVSTRKDAESLAAFVRSETGRACEAYHAGLPDAERGHVQEQFVSGRLETVVATNAFGMGVDRGDVRFVAHWSIPSDLESYYQEAGRAGRDGRPAVALLLYAPQDRQLKEWFIEQGAPTFDDLRAVYGYVQRQNAGRERRPEADAWDDGPGESDGDFLLRMSEALGIHASKLPNVLSRLKRAGALAEREDRVGPARWSAQRWHAPAVRAALQSSETHRDNQAASLLSIVRYAQASACRRRAILDHFGDEADTAVPPEDCCDACRTNARLKSEAPDEVPDWDALPMNARVALGLLDAVRRMRWPVGRLTLAKILAGSKAQGMEKYERHPYFGRLGTIGQGAVDGIYKDLLLKGYLRIGGDEYPVVELTPLGEQALDHREAIDVDVPAFGSAARASGASADGADLDPADAALFERLRAWRSERAAQQAVPPYVVFNDRTLRALAAARPRTDAEMLAVKGVGPAKWEAYGADVLALVAEAG